MYLLRFVPCLNRWFSGDDRTCIDKAGTLHTDKAELQLNFRTRTLNTFGVSLSSASFFLSSAIFFLCWREDIFESMIPFVAALNFENISVATLDDSSGQTFVERKQLIKSFFC